MACPASKQYFPLDSLEILRGEDSFPAREVSGNKLSLTKFKCPEPGCGKSVDVYYNEADNTGKPRYHYGPGESPPKGGGGTRARGTSKEPVSLTTGFETAQSRFHAEMRGLVQRAERMLASGETRIEGYRKIIKESEDRIAQIELDLESAKLILDDPQYAAYRTAEPEPETVLRKAEDGE